MAEDRSVGIPYTNSAGATSNPVAPQEGTYAKTVKGAFWFTVNFVAQKVLQVGIFVVMARLLVPADYGVITVILMTIGLFNLLTNIPFGTAIIQRRGDVEPYLHAYWTLDIFRSVFNALLIAVCGGWIAQWFGIQEYAFLIRISGILLIIPTFSNVRTAFLFRNMDFRTLAIRDISTQAAYGAAALAYALFVDRSPVALVVGYVTMYLTGVILSYILIPGRMRVSFAFSRLKDLVGYAKWVYGQGLVDYAAQYADKIVLGVMLVPAQLGAYAKAKDLSTSPAGFVVSMARKVGLSAMARVQENRVKIREGMLRGIDVLFLTAVPAALVFLLEGGAIVHILLGDVWLPIVVPLKIMAVGAIFFAVNNVMTTAVMAVGKPKESFAANLLQTVLMIPLAIIGIRTAGVPGLAFATSAVWAVLALYLFIRVRHTIQLSRFDAARFAFYGFAVTGVLWLLDRYVTPRVHAFESAMYDLGWIAALILFYYVLLFILGRFWAPGPIETGKSVLSQLRRPRP